MFPNFEYRRSSSLLYPTCIILPHSTISNASSLASISPFLPSPFLPPSRLRWTNNGSSFDMAIPSNSASDTFTACTSASDSSSTLTGPPNNASHASTTCPCRMRRRSSLRSSSSTRVASNGPATAFVMLAVQPSSCLASRVSRLDTLCQTMTTIMNGSFPHG